MNSQVLASQSIVTKPHSRNPSPVHAPPASESPIASFVNSWTWSRNIWWLTPRNVKESDETVALIAQKTQELNDLLVHYRYASMVAGEVVKTFPTLVGSWMESPHTVIGVSPKNSKEFRIVWVPIHLVQDQPAIVYFSREYNAIFIGAIDWPAPILSGIVFHELCHAMRYHQESPSSRARPGSFLSALGEIEAHQVQTEVFAAATAGIHGGYKGKVISILSRGNPSSPMDALDLVTEQDLRELNSMLGCKSCDGAIASVTTLHHLLFLGLKWIDQQQIKSGDQRKAISDWYNLISDEATRF